MAKPEFFDDMSGSGPAMVAALWPLVGIYRHCSTVCRAGMYRVIFCLDSQWGAHSTDAVMDDFGNMVPVRGWM